MFLDADALRHSAEVFGVFLDETALARLDTYAAFLAEYNQKVNLTAITDPAGIAVKHFEDSLALLRFLELPKGCRMADVGTGAGFPGVVLLIARPDLQLTLMDSTKKKLVFLQQLLQKLDLSAAVLHTRAEDAGQNPSYREQFDVVTARAVAELRVLAEYCLPLVKPGGQFAAMKATLIADERKNAAHALSVLGAKVEAQQDYALSNGDGRSLLLVKKVSQTSPKYPRPSALIAKKPL